jgi:hypothetical protein
MASLTPRLCTTGSEAMAGHAGACMAVGCRQGGDLHSLTLRRCIAAGVVAAPQLAQLRVQCLQRLQARVAGAVRQRSERGVQQGDVVARRREPAGPAGLQAPQHSARDVAAQLFVSRMTDSDKQANKHVRSDANAAVTGCVRCRPSMQDSK